MIITSSNSLCNDLLSVQLKDGVIDLSWAVDTDLLKHILQENSIEKILNFNENIDFDIQIDNVDSFDSINLKTYKFSELERNDELNEEQKTYRGKIIYSIVIPFYKDKFEETQYYFRVKINKNPFDYNVFINNKEIVQEISIDDKWSNEFSFLIRKNYTKDIIDIMYRTVADFNAYNKEAKSANFYYLFQAFATVLNEEFNYIEDEHNRKMINKVLPDMLQETFGVLFKFDDIYGLSMEEYRRIMRELIKGYQNGGAWNYIKSVLKYLIGYTPELYTLKNFYPWILRTKSMLGIIDSPENSKSNPTIYGLTDPENFSDRTYYNPESNYYLFTSDYENPKNKNLIMLLNNNERLFTFIVKADNFFNLNVDKTKIKSILNLLKSAYTKYSINVKDYVKPNPFDNIILVSDDIYLLAADNETILY